MIRTVVRSMGAWMGLASTFFLAPFPRVQAQEPPEVWSTGDHELLREAGSGEPQSFLGVNVWEVSTEVARKKNLPVGHGVIITSVVDGSAAEAAGLRRGDVVVDYDGQRVAGVKQFVRLVRETPIGRRVTLKLLRDGAEHNLEVVMGERKGWTPFEKGELPFGDWQLHMKGPKIVIPDMPHVYTTWHSTQLGIVAESLEPQLAEYFGVTEGVLVRSVGEDTPAARAGLRAGDVIVKVGDAAVASPREVTNALREYSGEPVVLSVTRNRQAMTLSVTVGEAGGGGDRRPRLLATPFDGAR